MFFIEDEWHSEQSDPFDTAADALAELRRRALMPWDEAPNQAPCLGWETCGREYHVVEYDEDWRLLSQKAILEVTRDGPRWLV